jgi:hypothetical protein
VACPRGFATAATMAMREPEKRRMCLKGNGPTRAAAGSHLARLRHDPAYGLFVARGKTESPCPRGHALPRRVLSAGIFAGGPGRPPAATRAKRCGRAPGPFI